MGVEDICKTGLSLGLGSILDSTPKNQLELDHHQQKKKSLSKSDHLFSCDLTLALSPQLIKEAAPMTDAGNKVVGKSANLNRQASSLSVVSSFSNSSVKRERDIIVEDVEVEKVVGSSSKVSSDHDQEDDHEEFGARKKLRLTKDQSLLLEESFKEHTTLNPKQKEALAKQLNLRPRQVEVWFQNRRARTKLKQTEVDCDMLKKRCEILTEENRRLHKEVQDLKALKGTAITAAAHAPFYMQLSAATFTLCPSCERISGANAAAATTTTTSSSVTESSSKSPFSSKPQFYTTFAHPSAASYTSLQTS
ncbi:hypothetical protein LguiA_006529 [Lonicera macranthoides]